MKAIRLFLTLGGVLLLSACGSDLQQAEKLYQQSQRVSSEFSAELADPLSEAIRLLECYLSRNHDEPHGTLLLWRCYLRAGHPRAQAMYENMLRMPERMRKILPDEISNEADEKMRERLVYLLGEMATAQEMPALIAILEHDHHPKVQGAAAEVLARLRHAKAISPLLRKLAAEQPAVRGYACRALSAFPQAEVSAALLVHLQDETEAPEVRHLAAQSLAAIGQVEFTGKAELLQKLEELLRAHSHAINTRLLAASTLAILGHESGHELALANANSPDTFQRGLAITILGYIGDKRALPFLTEALLNGNRVLRLQAAEALGRLGDAKALPSLYKALDDPNDTVREAAQQSINKIKAQSANG